MGTWSRRALLRAGGLAGAGAVLAACAPQVVEKVVEKEVTTVVKEVVKETVVVEGTAQIVEKEVTKVVKETVVVDKASELPVELQYWGTSLGLGEEWPHGKWETQEAERYMEMHPNVKIQFQAIGTDSIIKINVAISSGNPPNLHMRSGSAQVVWAIQGKCALELELPQDLVDDLLPGVYEAQQYNGKVYTVPIFSLAQGKVLNLSLVEEAGAEDLLPPPPAREWSFDQYLELMKKCTFTRANGQQAWGWMLNIMQDANLFWPEQGLMYNWGTDTIKYEDGKWQCRLDEPEGLAFLQWLKDLYEKHGVMPNPAGTTFNRSDYWNQGSLLGFIGPQISNSRQSYVTVDPDTLVCDDQEHGFKFIYVQSPKQPDVPHAVCWGGPKVSSNLGSFRTRDRLAIPWQNDFAYWMADKEHQIWLGQYLVPVRQSAMDVVSDPMLLWIREHWLPYARIRKANDVGMPTEEGAALLQVWQKIYTGGTPQEAVDGFCKDIAAIDWFTWESLA